MIQDVLPTGQVRFSRSHDLPRVDLLGDIDRAATARLEQAYLELAAGAPSHVVVDLAGATFFGCAGLTFLARLNLHLGSTGHRVRIVGPRRAAARVLALTGFTWDVDLPAATDLAPV